METPWDKVNRLEQELAEARRAAWASEERTQRSELTGAIVALTMPPPPGMLCGSRLTDTGERCIREADHPGDHDPKKAEEPCEACRTMGLVPDGTGNPDAWMSCPACGGNGGK